MTSSTFAGFTQKGQEVVKNYNGAAAASVSMLFIFGAMLLGVILKFKEHKRVD